jgi:hypothetical protein
MCSALASIIRRYRKLKEWRVYDDNEVGEVGVEKETKENFYNLSSL